MKTIMLVMKMSNPTVDAEADDPALALRMAAASSPELFSPPVFAALCSENLTAARLVAPMRLSCRESRQGLEVTWRWDDGVTFRDLVRDVRTVLARHYVKTTALPYAEVSFLLGFEEPSSFFRAFREWTGATPERVRSRAPARRAGATSLS